MVAITSAMSPSLPRDVRRHLLPEEGAVGHVELPKLQRLQPPQLYMLQPPTRIQSPDQIYHPGFKGEKMEKRLKGFFFPLCQFRRHFSISKDDAQSQH